MTVESVVLEAWKWVAEVCEQDLGCESTLQGSFRRRHRGRFGSALCRASYRAWPLR